MTDNRPDKKCLHLYINACRELLVAICHVYSDDRLVLIERRMATLLLIENGNGEPQDCATTEA